MQKCQIHVMQFILVLICLLSSSYAFRASRLRNSKLRENHILHSNFLEELRSSSADRLESVKAGVIGGLGGSLVSLPYALLYGLVNGFSAQFEFDHDALALCVALFSITYRYAVRMNENSKLREGVIGAFALTRTLSMVDVPNFCTPIPLNCGPPFGYLSESMILYGISNLLESFLAFGGAAFVLEKCFSLGIIKKFP